MPNTDKPRYIQVHQSDNVAIVVNEGGLPAGALLERCFAKAATGKVERIADGRSLEVIKTVLTSLLMEPSDLGKGEAL